MDIISQLQEQVNTVAALAFNTFGTLQRDAPPVRLSPNYPEPPPNSSDDAANFPDHPKAMSAALVKAAKQFDALVAALPSSQGGEEAQLRRIAELQAENDAIGQELQRQLEAAGRTPSLDRGSSASPGHEWCRHGRTTYLAPCVHNEVA